MCNDTRDHQILGFGTRIGTVRYESPTGLKGTLLARTFRTDRGPMITTHFGDATFLADLQAPGVFEDNRSVTVGSK